MPDPPKQKDAGGTASVERVYKRSVGAVQEVLAMSQNAAIAKWLQGACMTVRPPSALFRPDRAQIRRSSSRRRIAGGTIPLRFWREPRWTEQAIRSSEDAFVDELFAWRPQLGAPLIAARVPRAYHRPEPRGGRAGPRPDRGGGARAAQSARLLRPGGDSPRGGRTGGRSIAASWRCARRRRGSSSYWHPYHRCAARA